jgi:DegV family protein with EDD domain
MTRIGILTDTTNCLPPELISQYGIKVVPVTVIVNNRPYREQVDMTPAEFWEKFPTLKTLPSTSAPNPAEFLQAFEELSQKADIIIGILVSKILSGTHNAASLARKAFLEQKPGVTIEIVDSKCAAGALGFLVLEAARAVEAGQDFEQIMQLIKNMLPRVTYLTALETMRYLIKGGRAPKVAFIGELMGVRPIITNNKETGEVSSVSRAKGKEGAMGKMVDMVNDYIDPAKPLHMMVHYTTSIEDGEKLKEMVTKRYKCEELYMTPYSPVMAAHVGPVLSLAFYS